MKAVVKTLLVSASICFFAQSSIFPIEAERLPLEDMLKWGGGGAGGDGGGQLAPMTAAR